MARYLVFGLDKYPLGGWNDFIGKFSSLEEAREKGISVSTYDYVQIVDLETDKIVAELQR